MNERVNYFSLPDLPGVYNKANRAIIFLQSMRLFSLLTKFKIVSDFYSFNSIPSTFHFLYNDNTKKSTTIPSKKLLLLNNMSHFSFV